MEGCPDEESEVGFDVGRLKTGVGIVSVTAGDEEEEGVEACSVANRSGVGEAAMGLLHPTMKRKREIVKRDLSLFMIQFD
jgi:hypothetical protein